MTLFAPLAIILAPLLLALAPGWALLAALCPSGLMPIDEGMPVGRAKRIAEQLLRLAIAWPLGIAVCSASHFVAFMLFDGRPASVFTLETLVCVASLGVIVSCRVRSKRVAPIPTPPPAVAIAHASPAARWLTVLLALVTIACLVPTFGAIIGRTLVHPHGWWDAWMIWNGKARVLFLGNELWPRAFNPETGYAHMDYPLLLPLSIARLWSYAGQHTLLGPIVFTLGGAFAALLLLFASLSRLRDTSQGLLALLVTLAAPAFVDNAAMQLADMPLSIFMLAAIVSYACAPGSSQTSGASLGPRVIAGLCLGAASWTKNEGILFTAVFLLTTTAFDARASGLKPAMRSLAGAAVFGACILAHKLAHAGSTDLFRNRTVSDLASLASNTWRHDVIYRAIKQLTEINIGTKTAFVILVFIVAAALARRRGSKRRAFSAGGVAAIIVALMAAGYYVTYLLTPHDLVWHLGTSGMRLMWQLWPSGVFAALMLLPTPAELVATLTGREPAAEVPHTP